MPNNSSLISKTVLIAEKAGLKDITPLELGNGGNLIIHLAPVFGNGHVNRLLD
ncbi:hypothetical protein [Paenibacillus chitinolyticus]|uniref:hypothetical protein n=1 Tax=Paenibacillus chitinolyticus TaxID=79263 RepID=UPI003641B503